MKVKYHSVMRKKRHLLKVIAFLLLVLVFLSACKNEAYVPDFREMFPEGTGLSLGARSGETWYHPTHGYTTFGPVLLMDTPQDEIVISFGNFSGENSEYVLKILYNYEQVPFKVLSDESSVFMTDYVFFLETENDISIPVVLPDDIQMDGNTAILNVYVIAGPSFFQRDVRNFDTNRYGILNQFYIFFDQEHMRNVLITASEKSADGEWEYFDERLAELPWQPVLCDFDNQPYVFPEEEFGFNVTANLSGNIIDDIVLFPPPYVSAKPGEQIEFHYLLGDLFGGYIGEGYDNYKYVDRFVLIGMLDWEQTELNNQPLLPLRSSINETTEKPNAHYGTFTIVAPSEKGLYEFIAFAVGVTDYVSVFSNIENSFRITVVVE
jgi:hypothetical protein